jgi:hypothetical protein
MANPLPFAIPLLVVSCASSQSQTTPVQPGSDAGSDATYSHEAAVADGDVDASMRFGVSDGPIPASCHSCSADLHDVMDCDGGVLAHCPADQGCTPSGSCAPACDAARADQSTVGCDYYALAATDYYYPSTILAPQQCFGAFVANTWGAPVTVSVERAGTALHGISYAPQGRGQYLTYAPLAGDRIPAGGVAILFLSDDAPAPSCPAGVNVGVLGGVTTPGTIVTDAFHITTTAPVVAYTIFPYGGGTSAVTGATLLLPTSAWDTNYVATAAWSEGANGLPWIAFVAQADGTNVDILPTADIAAGTGVAAASQGKAQTYALKQGQAVRFHQQNDLTGSVVQSNHPIGAWGGHGCTFLEAPACDGMHMQIPPVRALGSEYVAVRYRDRDPSYQESPPWRFVGAVDGTALTYDPPVAGAPPSLGRGQVVEVDATGPFIVKSQDDSHPFFFAGHMTGCEKLPSYTSNCPGDPETVSVVPPAQYLSSYIFFTDPTYPETELVFVRPRAADGTFHDVTLDCKGVLGGWMPVGTGGNYEYTRADLVTGNFAAIGACDNGRHAASSDAPFALTVWGWGSNATTAGGGYSTEAVSYAYPAGAGIRPTNSVVVSVPNQ